MKQPEYSLFKNIDYPTVGLYLVLLLLGWVTIYAASHDVQTTGLLDISGRTGSQLLWAGISFGAIVGILLIDHNLIKNLSPYLYAGMLLLLVATIFIATPIKGSRSWLGITESIRLQPAEFAKLTTALLLAKWCSRYEFDIKNRRDLIISLLIFIVPMVVIVLQNETGSAVVFLAFLLVLFREGLNSFILLFGLFAAAIALLSIRYSSIMWGTTDAHDLILYTLITSAGVLMALRSAHAGLLSWLFLAALPTALLGCYIASFFMPVDYGLAAKGALGAVALLCVVALFLPRGRGQIATLLFILASVLILSGIDYFFDEVLQPHQRNRILVTLGLTDDPRGIGYNVNQSLIAIGSGGLTGKGFLNGTQTKLSYVPEQDTDFIFCTIGEEFGFIGSLVLIGLYLLFLLRLLHLAERQSDRFVRLYGYSVACIFFLHFVINIGMVIGLTPVIGIPLPFFSYGGSSLLSFSMLLFVFLRLDAGRQNVS